MIELTRWRDTLLLILIGLYFLLNYSFMLVRIGPIPVGELVLLLSLLLIDHRKTLPRFAKSALMIPFVIWLSVGFGHLLMGLPGHGMWALRDASHVIESLFLYIGFAFASNRGSLQRLNRWFPIALWVIFAYSFLYPFRNVLAPIMPTLSNMTDYGIPLVVHTNTAMLLVVGAAYHLQRHFSDQRNRSLAIAIVFITVALLLFPSRTLYLQLFCVLGYFMLSGGLKNAQKILGIAAVPFVLIGLILLSGLNVFGRFGDNFGLYDYFRLFLEIFGVGESAGGESLISSGNAIRYLWWSQILEASVSSWKNLFVGQGFGFPLIDFFIVGGTQVREPHNDVVGIFARMGLAGLFTFIALHALLIRNGIWLLRRGRHSARQADSFWPMRATLVALFFLQVCTLMVMLGESPFVMSFYAIPYYFSAGLLLRIRRLSLREQAHPANPASPQKAIPAYGH